MKTVLTRVVLLALLVFTFIFSAACGKAGQKEDFGIYLADSGEQVLSQEDIQAYSSSDHYLELNARGIAQWNSLHNYTGTPKISWDLNGGEFIMKIRGQEVARGTFVGTPSSMLYAGVVIYDPVSPLDSQYNRLWLGYDYVEGFTGTRYDNIYAEMDAYFK